jgi:cbb3-type cytochrome oxidase maturation protein
MKSLSLRGVVVFSLAVGVMVFAGAAFTYKMGEFALTIAKDDIQGFGAVAVVTYLLGMLPIVFLMLWAVASGKFRDIERPAVRVLELDEEIEREARSAVGGHPWPRP